MQTTVKESSILFGCDDTGIFVLTPRHDIIVTLDTPLDSIPSDQFVNVTYNGIQYSTIRDNIIE